MKKQVLVDARQYGVAPGGGGLPGRMLRELYGLRAVADSVGGDAWNVNLAAKIECGWNVGASGFIGGLLRHGGRSLLSFGRSLKPWKDRPTDIHCRVSISEHDDWYSRQRGEALQKIEQVTAGRRVVTGAYGRGGVRPVPAKQYYREIRDSKICVSPFGYGEICYRDFEAAALGCLLIKPAMDHLRTEPDISCRVRPTFRFVGTWRISPKR